ncbi:MAG: helix-turn-helix domain-containing protein [Kutzneria sp.]|nr:helix-turn-helix domain-containing protein [Kutzneria sp.]
MDNADTPATLATQVTDPDPAVGLRAVVALGRLLEELERLHVDNARDRGWSWQDIASALGVSRQSVHEKHAGRRRAQNRES